MRAEIVTNLGGATEVSRLKDIFEKHSNTIPRCAPAHGDLHATNVLVRHGDAIIIDFEKMEKHYPLTYDPASLEGGILVEGFVKDFKKNAIAPEKLVELLKPLYAADALIDRVELSCPRGSLVEWYYECVNQIRMRSWSAERESRQYALTLALCLIRKGCNNHDSFTNEQSISRAIAFFFGQSILREIEARSPKIKTECRRAGRKKGQVRRNGCETYFDKSQRWLARERGRIFEAPRRRSHC